MIIPIKLDFAISKTVIGIIFYSKKCRTFRLSINFFRKNANAFKIGISYEKKM